MTTTFLYLYTGEHGPISAVFLASTLEEARTTAVAEAQDWYHDAEDALGLPLGTRADIANATATKRGWRPVFSPNHGPFQIFTRP